MIRLGGKEPGRDIEIRVVGTRPGEKIAEELFDAREERLPPRAEGVLSARSQLVDLSILRKAITDLTWLCARQDDFGLRSALGSMVPGHTFDVGQGAGRGPGQVKRAEASFIASARGGAIVTPIAGRYRITAGVL